MRVKHMATLLVPFILGLGLAQAAQLPQPGGEIPIELIRVKPEARGPKDKRVPFTLTFANPREMRLAKGVYTLRSEHGPEFRNVLLTPLPPTGEIQQYLARI